jgi:hypothetical protein
MRLSQRGVSPGQKVHTVGGNPRGNPGQWLSTNGVVHQVGALEWQSDDGFRRSAEVIASQVLLNVLDGGGPVVDGRGALVGINAPGSQGATRAGHIDVSEVRDFLKAHYRSVGRNWVEEPDPEPVVVADADLEDAAACAEARQRGDPSRGRRDARRPRSRARFRCRNCWPSSARLMRRTGASGVPDGPRRGWRSGAAPPGVDRGGWAIPIRCRSAVRPGRVRQLGPEARRAVPAAAAPWATGRWRFAARRRRAGKIVPGRAESYSPLLGLLKDHEPEVRAAAAEPCSASASQRSLRHARSKEMLTDRTVPREARTHAAWGLGGWARGAALTEARRRTPSRACWPKAARWGRRSEVKGAGQALAKAVAHTDREVRVTAALALGQIGMDVTTLPGLVKALASEDSLCRSAVMNALPPMGALIKDPPRFGLPPEAANELRPMLASSEPVARAVSAYLLGTLGEQAAPAVPELKQALSKEKNPMAAREIACALAEIGPAAKDAARAARGR